MKIEELKKELEKLKDFKIYVFEGEVYVKVEDYREKTIENRKLKEDIAWYEKEEDRLREENKKLKESLDIATKCSSNEEDGIIRLIEENNKLNERIRFLEQCLDNKEKVNKSLREEIGELKVPQYTYGEPVVSSGPCL